MNSDNAAPEAPLPEDPKDWKPGSILAGRYEIEGFLAEGGMGVVLRAVHRGLNQPVAIKLLTTSARQSAELVARFLREARAVVGLSGEHTVRVFDVGTLDDGTPYIVMERLEGRDLREELTAWGPMPVEVAVDFVLQACLAIAEAHGAGVVHRDIKPSNLFLTQRADGTPLIKVLDFGISKFKRTDSEDVELTTTRTVLGSPQYMSPEQLRSPKNADPRTDIWALGVVLHELLVGSPPFIGETVPELSAAIAADPPRALCTSRPDAPKELEAVILKCLEKPMDARYASVAQLARALAAFAPIDGERLAIRVERICNPSLASSGGAKASERAWSATAVSRSDVVTPVAPVTPAAPKGGAFGQDGDRAGLRGGTVVAEAQPPKRGRLLRIVVPLALLALIAAAAGWWANADATGASPDGDDPAVATETRPEHAGSTDSPRAPQTPQTAKDAANDPSAAGPLPTAVRVEGETKPQRDSKTVPATGRSQAPKAREGAASPKRGDRPGRPPRKTERQRDPLEDRR